MSGRAARAGKLLCLDRKAFTELLGDLRQLRHTWRFEALRRVPLLQQLSNSARGQLCDIFEQVVVPKKTRIVSQGDPGDAFYIVETGVLAVVKDGKPIMRLSPGQVRRLLPWHAAGHACLCGARSVSVAATSMRCAFMRSGWVDGDVLRAACAVLCEDCVEVRVTGRERRA